MSEVEAPPITHFRYTTIVEFADTDMAGIMHFANFFRYMERAEHAFWRSLGLSVTLESEGEKLTWPRVQASCEYKLPLRFEDEVDVELELAELKPKAVLFSFRFRKRGESQLSAFGSVTAVCVRIDEAERRMRATQIPEHIVKKIQALQPI